MYPLFHPHTGGYTERFRILQYSAASFTLYLNS
jgi:hypothetical protein